MIEIIAAVYGGSFLLSMILTFAMVRAGSRQRGSLASQMLNRNLRKIELFWSFNRADFVPYTEGAPEADATAARNSFLKPALILSFCSLPGLLLLSLFTLSITVLAKPRREKAVFASRLCSAELGSDEVLSLVSELRI